MGAVARYARLSARPAALRSRRKGLTEEKASLVQWVVATVLADAPSSSTIVPAAAVFSTGLIGLDTCTAGQARSLRSSQASENICQCNHNPS